MGWNYLYKIEPTRVQVEQVEIKLPRFPKSFSGFRLVQISDIHVGPWMTPERFAGVVEIVMAQSPDLVAITGDIVLSYGHMPEDKPVLDRYVDAFRTLASECVAVAVLGNHDHWYNPFRVKDALEETGVKVMANSFISLERDNENFHIAGVDDVYESKDNLDAILADLPEEGGAILLAHEPDFADVSAKTGRFDLQISGHSHGGQVVFPFIGPLVLPYLGRKYHTGLYKVGDMYQYTNRGVGMTTPAIRFNCRPEITVFTLKAA